MNPESAEGKQKRMRVSVASPDSSGRTAIAEVILSPDGIIDLEPLAAGTEVVRLSDCLAKIKGMPALAIREERPRLINGEEVRVSTRVDVAAADPRYAWALLDTLRSQGFLCEPIHSERWHV